MLSARSTLLVLGALRLLKSVGSISSVSLGNNSIKKVLLQVNKNFNSVHLNFKAQASSNLLTKPIIFLGFLGFDAKRELKEANMDEEKSLYEQVDELFEKNKFQETVDQLRTFEVQNTANYQWRLSRALYELTKYAPASKQKSELIVEAFTCISAALEKNDENFVIHKWYAILLDAKSELDGIKERMKHLKTFEKHMLLAIELNPEDPSCRYILGSLYYGLADLPWYQRKLISAIFATPPEGTYEEALALCLQAESLQPDFYATNKLMIGKCYNQLKNYEKAKEYWTQAANITPGSEDDKKCKKEAQKFLSKIK